MLSPGTTISGYRIDGVLGEGGMGVVYEATQLSLDRKVALKVLATRLGDDDGFRRRFRREGRLQAAIDHPNIVAVHEAGESEAGLFLAMRLVRGRTLKELIRSGTLDASRTLAILRPIAEALDSAHAAGLIHRDVKPHNILVGPQDEAYLGDFGLTKAPDDLNLTRSGEFFGTPNYVAPEHVRGEPPTPSGDVYSFAAVLYECLTGMVPFPKASHAAVLFAHVHAPPPRVTALRPDLPPAIDDVLTRGMAKEPQRRQATATALFCEVEAALGEAASPFHVPAAPPVVRDPDDETLAPGEEPDGDTVLGTVGDATGPTVAGVPEGTAPLPAAAPGTAGGHRRAAVVAASAAAALAAAAAGLAVAPGAPAPGPAERALTAPGLRLTVPTAWHAARPPQALARAGFVTSVAPAAPEGAGLLAGRAGGATLPAGLRRAMARVPAPERVRVAGGQAYRYRGMRSRDGALQVTAYVLPTTRGAAVAACHAPAGASGFDAACERVAGTLRSTAGRVLPLGPHRAYAGELSRVLRRLDERRTAARRRLRAAANASGQAAQAARLADAFAAAARALGAVRPPAGGARAHSALRRALERDARAYRALRRAAATRSKDRYDAARRAVADAEAGVRDAVRALRGLGYRPA